ncbi:MAG: restriction endonuclease subunit S [Bacteroidales bacterium]|nr:restriction endonuclease subunit S [Bacteroidales bacterium]
MANKYWLLNLDKVEAQTGRILSIDYYDYEEIGNSVVSFDKTNVLYSKLRPYLNKVVVPTQIGYATSELVPLQPNASLLDRQYIAYMLRSKLFVDYISGKVAGAKMPRVTMSVFREFRVPVPPFPLQQSFAQKVESIERQKELINQSIREAQTLFDSRMEYYFGE